jgi:hypothetical protein
MIVIVSTARDITASGEKPRAHVSPKHPVSQPKSLAISIVYNRSKVRYLGGRVISNYSNECFGDNILTPFAN